MKKKKVLISCFFVSICFLLLASKCSPLYVINDWVDANAFFTMGKGMAHGLVPFKDLFEQKGPLLYFLHMIAYLISNKTFFGVYLLEVIALTVTLYYAYQIIKLETKESKISILPIFALFLLSHPSFKLGDSAEEFIFPMLMISLYAFLAFLKGEKELKTKDFLLHGFLAGCVLWIKYTMLGFWFAFMMILFLKYCSRKEYKKGIRSCMEFLIGMGLATLPWIFYFGIHSAIKEWIEVYFLINLNSYSHKANIFKRILSPFLVFLDNLKGYPITILFFLLGIGYLFKKKKYSIFFLFLFLILTVYIGGFGYRYYFYILLFFSLFGIIPITTFIKVSKEKERISFLLIFLFSFLLLFRLSGNTKTIFKAKKDYAQYVFLEEINKVKNPTLLNYGFIDGGFYLTSGITPNVRFFEKMNFNYESFPENVDAQNEYLKEKVTTFVVTKKNKNIPYLEQNYTLVKTFRKDSKTTYYLYRVKE